MSPMHVTLKAGVSRKIVFIVAHSIMYLRYFHNDNSEKHNCKQAYLPHKVLDKRVYN